MTKSRYQALFALTLIVGLSLTLAACGSSSSSSSSSESAGSESAATETESTASEETQSEGGEESEECPTTCPEEGGPNGEFVTPGEAAAFEEITGLKPLEKPATMPELKSRVTSYEATPTHLLIHRKLTKKPPTGKTIVVLTVKVPIINEFFEHQEEVAELLGWKMIKVELGESPEEYAQAYERAIQIHPDMVISAGVPREYFDQQLTELENENIPVIEWSSGVAAVPGHVWVAVDNPLYQAAGMETAEWLAYNGELKSNVVAFSSQPYAMIQQYVGTLGEYLPKLCPECQYTTEEVPTTDVGKMGSVVVAYLQTHPETNYVICGYGNLCEGVGQALKVAGLSEKVTLMSRDSATINLENVEQGLEQVAMVLPLKQTAYQVMDLAQRIFNGESTKNTRLAPTQILTEVTDAQSPLVGAVPTFEKDYEKLWLMG